MVASKQLLHPVAPYRTTRVVAFPAYFRVLPGNPKQSQDIFPSTLPNTAKWSSTLLAVLIPMYQH